MPQFDFPHPRRHNTLRLLGYEYNSPYQLCAVSLVTDIRRPLFADMKMAKSTLACLLSDEILAHMRLRAFTLMPDHLHFLAGVRQPEEYLPALIGSFKSYTTQQYWKRSREIIDSGEVSFTFDVHRKNKCERGARSDRGVNGLAGHAATGGGGIKELAQR